MRTSRLLALLTCLLILRAGSSAAEERRATTVGMPATIEQLVLPGPELEARPLEDPRSPIVLRIRATFPHGTDFRYDLVYYGLEAGDFDLKEYLRRKDGGSTADLPAIPVSITPMLPPGQIEPNPLPRRAAPQLGGYRGMCLVAAIAWGIGLLAILLVGRRRKSGKPERTEAELTVADRLRPYVQRAIDGQLSPTEKAELERMLLAFWRDKLQLEHLPAPQAMTHLRGHPQAGELLQQLERWLHQPHRPGDRPSDGDLAKWLAPYQHSAMMEIPRC